MRILFINYEYPPVGGGAATATAAIARALVDLGHAVVILTGKFKRLPEVSESDGIVVHRIPSLRTKIDRSGVFEMGLFLICGLIFTRSIITLRPAWSARPMELWHTVCRLAARRGCSRQRTVIEFPPPFIGSGSSCGLEERRRNHS